MSGSQCEMNSPIAPTHPRQRFQYLQILKSESNVSLFSKSIPVTFGERDSKRCCSPPDPSPEQQTTIIRRRPANQTGLKFNRWGFMQQLNLRIQTIILHTLAGNPGLVL